MNVRLPLETAFLELVAPDSRSSQDSTPTSLPASRSAAAPLRVLVIDDDEPMGWVIRRALREEAEVVAETDPFEALRRLGGGQKFDLVLCDVMMPGMTGVQLFETLRWSRPDYIDRFAFMTSTGLGTLEERSIASTGVPVLTKPFRTPELRQLVRTLSR